MTREATLGFSGEDLFRNTREIGPKAAWFFLSKENLDALRR